MAIPPTGVSNVNRTDIARTLVRAFPGMTGREADCAALVAAGMDNANIGIVLGISEVTVKVTLLRVPSRMGVSRGGSARVRVALGVWATLGVPPAPVVVGV